MSMAHRPDPATQHRRKRATEGNLFGSRPSRRGRSAYTRQRGVGPKKRRKTVKSIRPEGKSSLPVDFLPNQECPTSVKKLLRRDMATGVSVLGVVERVDDELYDARVSLPDHLVASFTLADLSNSVTNGLAGTLQTSANEELETSQLPPLSMFVRETQFVRCIVTEDQTQADRSMLRVTLNPTLLPASDVVRKNKFTEGMVVCGWIQSEEDHGYVVAIGQGSRGIKAFLPRSKVDVKSGPLRVGAVVDCVVSRVNASTNSLLLALAPILLPEPTPIEQLPTIRSVLPGMLVEAKVEALLPGGLWLRFGDYFTGLVDAFHLPTPMPSGRGGKQTGRTFKPGQTIQARVVYVDYDKKEVRLSLRPHLLAGRPAAFGLDRYNGALYDCLAVNDEFGAGMFMVLLERVPHSSGERIEERTQITPSEASGAGPEGAMSKKKKKLRFGFLPAKEVLGLAERGEVLRVGGKLRCRIVGRNGLDGLLTLSCDPRVLNEPFMSIHELRPGDKVSGTVCRIHKDGLLVRLSRYLRGFCPSLHLSDVRLSDTENRFAVGQGVQCRVLLADADAGKLYLTLKRTLVEDDSTPIRSYREATPGVRAFGTVIGIREAAGLVIGFYGGVKGLCCREDLPELHQAGSLRSIYWKGQVVRCTVIEGPPRSSAGFSAPEDGRVYVSLRGYPADPGLGEVGVAPLHAGTVVAGTVLRVDEERRGRVVEVRGMEGWLPDSHLSDHLSLVSGYDSLLGVGTTLPVVVVRVTEGRVALSKKPLLLQGSLGPLLPAYVTRIRKGGVVVAFATPEGRVMRGMVPGPFIPAPTEARAEKASVKARMARAGLDIGQTVLCTFLEEGGSSGNRSLSLLPATLGVERFAVFLRSYLKERAGLGTTDVEWGKYALGIHVRGTVVAVRQFGALLDLHDGAKGLCISSQLEDDLDEGDEVEGVVLDVDEATGCIDLSFRSDLIHTLKTLHAEMRLEDEVTGVVQLVKEHYLVVTVGSAVVYAAVRDFNSPPIASFDRWNVGQTIPLKVLGTISEPRHCVLAANVE